MAQVERRPRHRGMLVSGCVGQVPTDTRGDEVEAVCGAVGEPRRQPAKELARLIPAGCVLYRSDHCHWFVRGPLRHAWFRVAVVNRVPPRAVGEGLSRGHRRVRSSGASSQPYRRQAGRLSKTLLASDRKRRAIDGEELARKARQKRRRADLLGQPLLNSFSCVSSYPARLRPPQFAN
jgi:hypothetical protein